MSDLPDRERYHEYGPTLSKVELAYLRGELKSRDEMNEEAIERAVDDWWGSGISNEDFRKKLADAAWEAVPNE